MPYICQSSITLVVVWHSPVLTYLLYIENHESTWSQLCRHRSRWCQKMSLSWQPLVPPVTTKSASKWLFFSVSSSFIKTHTDRVHSKHNSIKPLLPSIDLILGPFWLIVVSLQVLGCRYICRSHNTQYKTYLFELLQDLHKEHHNVHFITYFTAISVTVYLFNSSWHRTFYGHDFAWRRALYF